ncbi:MAG: carboxylating nicotinate-nucleotide diphosphorylase [Chloroflexi bacterium]|nr:carboxylating nicotinate-nucleotide diphosphorylase [Chloroflexota bacterium]
MELDLAIPQIRRIVQIALEEDLGLGDPTTDILIHPEMQGWGDFLVKSEGVLAGLPVMALLFNEIDPSLKFQALAKDGDRVHPGDIVARVHGRVTAILKGERVALNFLQQMSGVATETARYVAAVADLPCRIIDTRKTTPGLRLLEKHAVRMGGAYNHRQNLEDGILIKDNHLVALRSQGVGLGEAVRRARQEASHTVKIEVEVESFSEAQEAVEAGADIIMMDNMPVPEISRTVSWVAGRAVTEASGGVTLNNVRQVAETGVSLIAVGAITHSAKSLDIGLELYMEKSEGS